MPPEPPKKRTFVFIDGQNLFYAVKQAFGFNYPNYDPLALAQWVCHQRGWQLAETHFYTGLPQVKDSSFWNYFWTAKLAVMGTRGIKTFSRHLKYRNQTVNLPGGKTTTVLVGQEKGVDVRLALDVVRFAREDKYDVGVIFSQDQDLSELATEVRSIVRDSTAGSSSLAYIPLVQRPRTVVGSAEWIGLRLTGQPTTRASIRTTTDRSRYRQDRNFYIQKVAVLWSMHLCNQGRSEQ